jgi:hypothetical protein
MLQEIAQKKHEKHCIAVIQCVYVVKNGQGLKRERKTQSKSCLSRNSTKKHEKQCIAVIQCVYVVKNGQGLRERDAVKIMFFKK